jgi:hypothetical protein
LRSGGGGGCRSDVKSRAGGSSECAKRNHRSGLQRQGMLRNSGKDRERRECSESGPRMALCSHCGVGRNEYVVRSG